MKAFVQSPLVARGGAFPEGGRLYRLRHLSGRTFEDGPRDLVTLDAYTLTALPDLALSAGGDVPYCWALSVVPTVTPVAGQCQIVINGSGASLPAYGFVGYDGTGAEMWRVASDNGLSQPIAITSDGRVFTARTFSQASPAIAQIILSERDPLTGLVIDEGTLDIYEGFGTEVLEENFVARGLATYTSYLNQAFQPINECARWVGVTPDAPMQPFGQGFSANAQPGRVSGAPVIGLGRGNALKAYTPDLLTEIRSDAPVTVSDILIYSDQHDGDAGVYFIRYRDNGWAVLDQAGILQEQVLFPADLDEGFSVRWNDE